MKLAQKNSMEDKSHDLPLLFELLNLDDMLKSVAPTSGSKIRKIRLGELANLVPYEQQGIASSPILYYLHTQLHYFSFL